MPVAPDLPKKMMRVITSYRTDKATPLVIKFILNSNCGIKVNLNHFKICYKIFLIQYSEKTQIHLLKFINPLHGLWRSLVGESPPWRGGTCWRRPSPFHCQPAYISLYLRMLFTSYFLAKFHYKNINFLEESRYLKTDKTSHSQAQRGCTVINNINYLFFFTPYTIGRYIL